ncbi:hypothetical protein ISS07_00555 [Candidatus Woesearchaeota archaeon]|nr:hypothetical protein [Candidatus Woesearchaeota archaeon]
MEGNIPVFYNKKSGQYGYACMNGELSKAVGTYFGASPESVGSELRQQIKFSGEARRNVGAKPVPGIPDLSFLAKGDLRPVNHDELEAVLSTFNGTTH